MTSTKIYINELGYRDAISEQEQISWFWKQYVKRYVSKNHRTRFWLDLMERYEKHFLKIQAFELLKFLKEQLSDEQIENRKMWKLKMKMKSQLELEHWKDWRRDYEFKNKLTTIQSLN